MTLKEIIQTVSERIQNTATVKTVYGDPVTAEGKTIIPVAKVRYGFGGGGGWGSEGSANNGDGDKGGEGSGGGGGGGVEVRPVGMIEITTGETRYISFEDNRRIAKLVVLGMILSFLLVRRKLKNRK